MRFLILSFVVFHLEMEDIQFTLASGPLHFGLAESVHHAPYPAAISVTGRVYRLELKQKVKGRRPVGDSSSDFRLRCVNVGCRQFMGDTGRVSHTASCRRHSDEELRQWVANWLGFKLF